MSKGKKRKVGPKSETLVIPGDWKDAVGQALRKERPENGWPDRPVKKRRKRSPKSK